MKLVFLQTVGFPIMLASESSNLYNDLDVGGKSEKCLHRANWKVCDNIELMEQKWWRYIIVRVSQKYYEILL